jgi:hypothetical protein
MDQVFAVASGGILPVAAGARPSSPYPGQALYDTAPLIHDGSAWQPPSNFSRSRLIFTPGAQADGPVSTGVWVTLGSVTVPSWATKADVTLCFMGIWQTGSANDTIMNVRATIGAVNGAFVRYSGHDPGASSIQQQALPLQDVLTGLTAGVKTVTLDTNRVAGTTGTLRCGTSSRCVAFFDWYA